VRRGDPWLIRCDRQRPRVFSRVSAGARFRAGEPLPGDVVLRDDHGVTFARFPYDSGVVAQEPRNHPVWNIIDVTYFDAEEMQIAIVADGRLKTDVSGQVTRVLHLFCQAVEETAVEAHHGFKVALDEDLLASDQLDSRFFSSLCHVIPS